MRARWGPRVRERVEVRPRSRPVHALLGVIESIVEQGLDGVRRLGDVEGQGLAQLARRAFQHIVGALFLGRRLADTNAHASELLAVHGVGDGTKSVVPSQSPAKLDLHASGL